MSQYVNLPLTGGGGGSVEASAVTVTPSGNLSATNAQAAFVELQGDIDNRMLASWDPTIYTPPLFDDFDNYANGTVTGSFPYWAIASGTGALNQRGTVTSSEKNRRGVIRCSPGSAAAAHYAVMTNIQDMYVGDAIHTYACAVKFTTVPDGTNDYRFSIGFCDNWPTSNNKIWLGLDRTIHATNFVAITAKAGVVTSTNTTVAPANATWVNLRVVVNTAASSCTFYINGTLVATHTTNIPNATTIGPSIIGAWVAGAAVNHDLDWHYLQFTPGTARGTF